MSDDPPLCIFTTSYLASTLILTAEQHGAYLLLLMVASREGGSLPNDDVKLARVARVSVKTFRQIWDDLRGFFYLVDGRLVSIHLVEWAAEMRRYVGRKTIPPDLRRRVFERDGESCAYCGTDEGPFHIDHVHPFALGGADELENLAVACRSCNLSKGAKPLAEWLQ